MTGRTVAAVIPNWNKAEMLAQVLADLSAQTHPLQKILVVDNASSDDSGAAADRAGVQVIRLERNHGFAYAVNRGIEQCATDWVLILNNDVRLGPEWLATLVAAAVESDAWFATGKLLSAAHANTIDGTYDAVSRAGTAWRCGNGMADGPIWSKARRVAMIPLTAALVRRELFDRIGLLDEAFESYLEDVDFGLRCAAANYTGVYTPAAVAHHAGSATLGTWHNSTVRRIARNQVLLTRKHFRSAPWWPIVAGQLLWGLVAARHGAGFAWIVGKLEGLRMTRVEACSNWATLGPAIRSSEAELRRLQQASGFDLYWKLYFAVVRS